VSVCGTDSVSHACSNFSGQHFDRNYFLRNFHLRPLGRLDGYNHESAPAIILRIAAQTHTSTGILTRCPSPTLYCLGLGPTNPGAITVAQETLLFRWAGFSPALWLLIPTFSLPHAPANLAIHLHCREERSSTTPLNK
jgi:hypothetical protein